MEEDTDYVNQEETKQINEIAPKRKVGDCSSDNSIIIILVIRRRKRIFQKSQRNECNFRRN